MQDRLKYFQNQSLSIRVPQCSTKPTGKDRNSVSPADECMGDGSVGEVGGNSIPQAPRPFLPPLGMQRVKFQNSSRDSKERAGWDYKSPRGSMNESSQRNQSHEVVMAQCSCEPSVSGTRVGPGRRGPHAGEAPGTRP